MIKSALLALALISIPVAANADDNMASMDHSQMQHETTATDLFAPSRDSMHKDMNVPSTGNVDADFVRNMIPHHEGAVAMAKVELEHGKDPELRKLAEDIIKAQDKEIAFMKAWLSKHPQ